VRERRKSEGVRERASERERRASESERERQRKRAG
jgi:hypothetical protein